MRHRPGEFDTVLFADYSGAASLAVQRRAIVLWRADRGARPRKVEGPFTRETLREKLLVLLLQATREGRRVLFGTDHQWSWPRDLWAVAGQTLVGLRELHRLLRDARELGVEILAWPMDALADDGRSHLGCEIYPSFCRPRHVRETDDADARWTCRWASRADLARALDLTGAPAACGRRLGSRAGSSGPVCRRATAGRRGGEARGRGPRAPRGDRVRRDAGPRRGAARRSRARPGRGRGGAGAVGS